MCVNLFSGGGLANSQLKIVSGGSLTRKNDMLIYLVVLIKILYCLSTNNLNK